MLDVSWLANLSVPRREMPQPLRWFSVCWHRDVCISWRSGACFFRHDGDRNLPAGRGRRLWTSSGVLCGVWTPPFFGHIEEHTAEERVEDVHCSITCGEEDDLRGEKWELGGSYSPESCSGDEGFLFLAEEVSHGEQQRENAHEQAWPSVEGILFTSTGQTCDVVGSLHLEGR